MNERSIIRKTIIILFWVGVWAIAAAMINQPLLLPSPVSVAVRIFELALHSQFWTITSLSLLRIMAGIIIAVVLGLFIAILITYSRLLRDLLSPILTIIKVTPVASFIILVLIWIGRDIVPAVIAALMVLPVVCNNVSAGLRNIDHDILEMAKAYQIPRLTQFKRITVPSVMPHFLSAIETSIGIGWKAGIAAEVLTVPAFSIGKMIFESKMYLETIDLFAWTVVVILISLIIESIIVRSMKRFGRKYNSEVAVHD
ncbi:MAG: ABC transporter permease subunit [Oscillospiraceae bacterium]|nr:ABC transporter permease subunit [Oscillospiraceae bacterium]